MTPTPPLDLEAMAAAAQQRIAQYIQRSAAQHLRAMRKNWAAFRLPDGYYTGNGQQDGPATRIRYNEPFWLTKKGT